MESGESPEAKTEAAQPSEATEHQQQADATSPRDDEIEPTAGEGAGDTTDQPPAQDQQREGDDPTISADNEGESGQHVDDHITDAGTKEGGEEEQPTELQHPNKAEEGITLEAGEQETHKEIGDAEPETETRRPETEASKQESDQGDGKSDRPTTERSHASTESERSRRKGIDKNKEIEKKETEKKETEKKETKKERHRDKEKKHKKRSKQQSHSESPHTVRKRSTKSDARSQQVGRGSKQLEAILLSIFQPFDPDGNGYMEPSVFWEVLQSSELNLQLAGDEVTTLKEVIQPDTSSGQIPYGEFSTHAADVIASLYQSQPASDTHWVELRAADGSVVVSYNKQTGEVRDLAEAGIDLFEDIIKDMFQLADTQGKGYVSKEEFTQMLQSQEMITYLTEEDILQMQQYFDAIPNAQATYSEFYPLAKELILRVYRVKDPSDSEWCQLNSPRVGIFFFNKYTGETRRGAQGPAVTGDREQQIAFVEQAYAQVEAVNFELEQYKQETRELANQVALANEEQEALATQLYETGHALDEATAEIQAKDGELEELRAIISGKEGEIETFRATVAEFERVKETLVLTQQELQNARDTIAARDRSISERDANNTELQRQIEVITDRLKTSHGVVDARDSSISSIQHQLRMEQAKTKELEKQVPSLENRVSSLEDELCHTRQTLEEKTSSLTQTRKHLKNAREKNMDLEKEVERLGQTHDKLRAAESEIHTLKSFLTSKTAMVERRKKELQDVKARLAELEEKDNRRAVILADVLEKTARQYQQQLTSTKTATPAATKAVSFQTPLSPTGLKGMLPGDRPFSAPAIPPEGGLLPEGMEEEGLHKTPHILKTYTLEKPTPTTAPTTFRPTKPPGKKARIRSRSVPKLPPIRRHPQQRQFKFSTSMDLRHMHREQDTLLVDHAPSNPQCNCEMCRMNASIGAPGIRPETGFTGLTTQTGLSGYRSEIDSRELVLAQQIQIGQRVLVRMKKSEYDLEPQKLTGIVKYVGKVDSEFVDNRLYVGVKLDEGVGDTDGLFKGKRYFTCPPKHGKMVRITNIFAVLPNKSVLYKQLQDMSKRSPYNMTVQKKTGSVKVS